MLEPAKRHVNGNSRNIEIEIVLGVRDHLVCETIHRGLQRYPPPSNRRLHSDASSEYVHSSSIAAIRPMNGSVPRNTRAMGTPEIVEITKSVDQTGIARSSAFPVVCTASGM